MIDVYKRLIKTDYHVQVSVNGASMVYSGEGYGRDTTGEVGVDVEAKSDCPKGFNHSLLAFCLLTGQADIGKCLPGVTNPFQANLGAYRAHRTLALDSGGSLTADYRVGKMRSDGTRTATFQIAGRTNVPAITAIRPTFEMWVPDGNHYLRGHFTLVFVLEDGSFLKGEVDTQYSGLGFDLEDVQYRRIEFDLVSGARKFRQTEKIVLSRDGAALATAA